MGGKTWSVEEEKYFWEVIVPQSQQAVRPSDRVHSWDTLATMMQGAMGEPRRRDYTRTMLYEHYYQNIKTGSHSPKAKLYVRKHKADLKAEAEREQSESVAASSPSHAGSPAVSTVASRESRPASVLGRESAPPQSAPDQNRYAHPIQRVPLPRGAPCAISTPSQPPPLCYSQTPFHRSPLSRSSLPPPQSYPRAPTPYEPCQPPSAFVRLPDGLKRRAEDLDVDRAPAKRHQLSILEPAAYYPQQYSLGPTAHIRQASEEWLHQLPPPPRTYTTPPQHPRRSPLPRINAVSSIRVEPLRADLERPAPVLITSEAGMMTGGPGDLSRLDTLVWASRVHSNVAEGNDPSSTSSETNSQDRSRSASHSTTTPEGSNPDNGETTSREDEVATRKQGNRTSPE